MIRVISSPSSSTPGFLTLIFAIAHRPLNRARGAIQGAGRGRRVAAADDRAAGPAGVAIAPPARVRKFAQARGRLLLIGVPHEGGRVGLVPAATKTGGSWRNDPQFGRRG